MSFSIKNIIAAIFFTTPTILMALVLLYFSKDQNSDFALSVRRIGPVANNFNFQSSKDVKFTAQSEDQYLWDQLIKHDPMLLLPYFSFSRNENAVCHAQAPSQEVITVRGNVKYRMWAQWIGLAPFIVGKAGNHHEFSLPPPRDDNRFIELLRQGDFQFLDGTGESMKLPNTNLTLKSVPLSAGQTKTAVFSFPSLSDPNVYHNWMNNQFQCVYLAREQAQVPFDDFTVIIDAAKSSRESVWARSLLGTLAKNIIYAADVMNNTESAILEFNVVMSIGVFRGYPYRFSNYEPDLRPSHPNMFLAESIKVQLGVADRDPRGGYVLFIERKRTRKLVDATTLKLQTILDEMCAFGLDVRFVNAEELSFKEQVELAAGAAVIVGSHGAGLTNTVFMRRQSHVIEITLRYGWCCYEIPQISRVSADTKWEPCGPPCKAYHKTDYPNLVNSMGLVYWYVDPVYCENRSGGNPIEVEYVHVNATQLAMVTRMAYEQSIRREI
jgi:hypothetical protein